MSGVPEGAGVPGVAGVTGVAGVAGGERGVGTALNTFSFVERQGTSDIKILIHIPIQMGYLI